MTGPRARRRPLLARCTLTLLTLAAVAALGSCIDPEDTFEYVPPGPPLVEPGSDAELPDPVGVDVVRIATYNVHLLFDTECDSGRCSTRDFENAPTRAELDTQIEELAFGISRLEADVVLLQEIENELVLKELFDRVSNQFRFALIGETGGSATIDVAVLANAELIQARSHRGQVLQRQEGGTTTFTRDFLEVRLAFTQGAMDADRVEAVVFVAHFKSKSNDDPSRRLAEAVGAAEIMTVAVEDFPGALVVMGGDLNDTPDSEPLQALEAAGMRRVASDIPAAAAVTYPSRDEAIDHLYLATDGAGSYVPQSSRVFTESAGLGGWGGSDHGALRADFNLP